MIFGKINLSNFLQQNKLPSDIFGDNFEFDGDQGCHPTLQNEEYVYNRPLGNCGVELSRGQNANGDGIITFKKDITAIGKAHIFTFIMIIIFLFIGYEYF